MVCRLISGVGLNGNRAIFQKIKAFTAPAQTVGIYSTSKLFLYKKPSDKFSQGFFIIVPFVYLQHGSTKFTR